MKRVFMAGCPRRQKAFVVVDWELRSCPFCQQRFWPAEAASPDERHRG